MTTRLPHRVNFSIAQSAYWATRRVPEGYPRTFVREACIISNLDSGADDFLTGGLLARGGENEGEIPQTIQINQEVILPTNRYKAGIDALNNYFFNTLQPIRGSVALRNAIDRYNQNISAYFLREFPDLTTEQIADAVKPRRWDSSNFPDYTDDLIEGFDGARTFNPGIAFPRRGFLQLQVQDIIVTFEGERQQSVTVARGFESNLVNHIRLARTATDVTRLTLSLQSKYLP